MSNLKLDGGENPHKERREDVPPQPVKRNM